MEHHVYWTMHLVGLMALYLGLGVKTLRSPGDSSSGPLPAILHGLGLLLMLVGGFGMLARLGIGGAPPWVWIKVALWAVLGMLPFLVRKGWVPVGWAAALLLGGAAAYIGHGWREMFGA